MAQNVTEEHTLYQAQAGIGYQIILSVVRKLVSVSINGGEIWVRARYVPDLSGTLPTNPVPANGVVANWTRMVSGGPVLTYGDEVSTRSPYGPKIKFLDVWCVSAGDILVTAQ